MRLLAMDAPPLTPDLDTAQFWLRTELAQGIYGESESLLSKLWRGFLDFLSRLSFDASPSWGLALVVLLISVVVVLAVLFGGRLRFTKSAKKSAAVFDDVVATAAQYWEQARASANSGDLSGALLFSFRAIVRGAEERVVISEQPGRTAVEAATDMGRALEPFAAQLSQAAHLFDEVVYGDRRAGLPDYEALVELGQRLEQHKSAGDTKTLMPESVGGDRP